MRMILLLLGWHFTLAGIIAIILGVVVYSVPCLIFGVGMFLVGLVMSILLRKTCSTYKSDAIDESGKRKPEGFI